jgi:hypothetical protein
MGPRKRTNGFPVTGDLRQPRRQNCQESWSVLRGREEAATGPVSGAAGLAEIGDQGGADGATDPAGARLELRKHLEDLCLTPASETGERVIG